MTVSTADVDRAIAALTANGTIAREAARARAELAEIDSGIESSLQWGGTAFALALLCRRLAVRGRYVAAVERLLVAQLGVRPRRQGGCLRPRALRQRLAPMADEICAQNDALAEALQDVLARVQACAGLPVLPMTRR